MRSMAQGRRAFILGAGFSKPAGMPLATELLDAILAVDGLGDDEELRDYLTGLQRRLAWLSPDQDDKSLPLLNKSLPPLNIEQLFHYAYFDIEIERMKQHLVPVGRGGGPGTPWRQAEDVTAWLSYLHEDLGRAVFGRDDSADLEPIKRWAQTVGDGDVVLTFNYDTLVERSMEALNRSWNHGTCRKGDAGVPVFKLHGSIDWLVIDKAETGNHTLLFEKASVNADGQKTGHREDDCALVRLNRDQLRAWVNNSGLEYVSPSNWPRQPGIAGLGAYKELHTVPGLGVVWAKAMRALREAEVAVIIGFSMSDFDALAQMQFAGVAQARHATGPPLRVIVVDPHVTATSEERFQRVFRDVEFRREAHESIDWSRFSP